jgi:hypothetical protein
MTWNRSLMGVIWIAGADEAEKTLMMLLIVMLTIMTLSLKLTLCFPRLV